jgi:outer membrane protein assembly factor BamB
MIRPSRLLQSMVALPCMIALPLSAMSQDWPQWNGPHRDGTLPKAFISKPVSPKTQIKWKASVGYGYSGPVVAAGRVYVSDYQLESGKITNNPGSRDKLMGKERIVCFDEKTGEKLWVHAYDRNYAVSFGGGPRATPVVADGMVIALGAEGDLVCLSSDSGKVLWQRQFADEYKSVTPMWGHAAVPLIVGDQLICMVGGEGSLVVSLDRKTGKEKWRALSGDDVGYCPPSLIHHGGVAQLIVWSPEKLASLNPDNGKLYWEQPLKPDYGMSVAPPIVRGDLLFASGEGVSAMFQLTANPPQASILWKGQAKKSLGLSNTVAIFDDGYIYGADYQSGTLVCVRQSDGERMWQSAMATTGVDREKGASNSSVYLIKADANHYYMLSETGDFISAQLTPSGYKETGRFHAIDPTNVSSGRNVLWTFPAIANGCLLVRNDQELRCFEIGPPAQEWVSLFDGKSIDGWQANEKPESFSVENGELKLKGGMAHLFCTREGFADLKNFEFKAEVKTLPGANSGVFFHTENRGPGGLKKGYEAQINTSFVKDPRKTGSLVDVRDLNQSPVADNEWFEFHLVVDGKHISVNINGKNVVDYTEEVPPIRKKGREERILSHGAIAIQAHDPESTTYFRNIRVKKLP